MTFAASNPRNIADRRHLWALERDQNQGKSDENASKEVVVGKEGNEAAAKCGQIDRLRPDWEVGRGCHEVSRLEHTLLIASIIVECVGELHIVAGT